MISATIFWYFVYTTLYLIADVCFLGIGFICLDKATDNISGSYWKFMLYWILGIQSIRFMPLLKEYLFKEP